ncbi:unnamed protein product [Paramecium sonneborni]|uniref:Uncharacterized protein n=1 Tax=Paramecium sonneborni TaxID=65129 RepID=A0A8S1RFU1_9CILI|nr:unnamed protein product [Paramecium sonneborni]
MLRYLYSLNNASTDVDLTSQIIHLASIKLTKFIIDYNQFFRIIIKLFKISLPKILNISISNIFKIHYLYEYRKLFKDINIIIQQIIIFWPQSIISLYGTIKYFSEENTNIEIFVQGIKRYKQTENQINNLFTIIQRPRVLVKQINDYKQIITIYKL